MLLEAHNLKKTYRSGSHDVAALDDVSLSLDAGDFVAIRGPSGCGKTTLLLVAGGLLQPDSGELMIDGVKPYNLAANQRAQLRTKQIGFVFQQFHLVPYLSLFENVLVPAVASHLPDAESRAKQLIEEVGLTNRMHHTPGELSTGERQRTALARALLNRPSLLLADEPTGNLDRENAEIVLRHLQEFTEQGGGVLLVTHDTRASDAAKRVLQIEDGRLVP
ncbi:MAG: ABC transporter ATP-binding protein [Planctomycetota bacterium]|nr:ABC transporter ATP-binding protein [Planctomycetota bacterium]